jgi:hypothetical protein
MLPIDASMTLYVCEDGGGEGMWDLESRWKY